MIDVVLNLLNKSNAGFISKTSTSASRAIQTMHKPFQKALSRSTEMTDCWTYSDGRTKHDGPIHKAFEKKGRKKREKQACPCPAGSRCIKDKVPSGKEPKKKESLEAIMARRQLKGL